MNCQTCRAPMRNVSIFVNPIWHCDACEPAADSAIAIGRSESCGSSFRVISLGSFSIGVGDVLKDDLGHSAEVGGLFRPEGAPFDQVEVVLHVLHTGAEKRIKISRIRDCCRTGIWKQFDLTGKEISNGF